MHRAPCRPPCLTPQLKSPGHFGHFGRVETANHVHKSQCFPADSPRDLALPTHAGVAFAAGRVPRRSTVAQRATSRGRAMIARRRHRSSCAGGRECDLRPSAVRRPHLRARTCHLCMVVTACAGACRPVHATCSGNGAAWQPGGRRAACTPRGGYGAPWPPKRWAACTPRGVYAVGEAATAATVPARRVLGYAVSRRLRHAGPFRGLQQGRSL